MLPDLSEIKMLRKQHNLTQAGLASASGVSQSLIAKLEAGSITPSYDRAKKLFDALERMHEKSRLAAGDVMAGKVKHANKSDSIKKAIKLLEKNALSQLPVLKDGQSIGLVTEKGILAKMGRGIDIENGRVEEIMDEAAPTIQENTPLQIISQLLNYSPCVLVKKKGKIRGIITKSDLLKTMLKKN